MLDLFGEMPFNVIFDKFNNRITFNNHISEIILFIESHDKYSNDKELLVLVYKYLGIYLQMINYKISKYYDTKIKYYNTIIYDINLSDIIDENGNTLLHHFAVLGYYELVELLLMKYKIEPNIHNNGIDADTNRDDPGKTALMCVIDLDWKNEFKQKYLDICILLVKYGSDWSQIFRLSFWGFNYHIYLKIKKNNIINNIEKNIIELMTNLKKMELIDINIKCVRYTSIKFGRLTDPDGFGRGIYFYNINLPLLMSHNKDSENKPILFLAILTKNKPIIDWLIKNGAEMKNYAEYEKLDSEYIKNINKDYIYNKRKALLEVIEGNYNIKYLTGNYEVREVASYL